MNIPVFYPVRTNISGFPFQCANPPQTHAAQGFAALCNKRTFSTCHAQKQAQTATEKARWFPVDFHSFHMLFHIKTLDFACKTAFMWKT